MLDLRMHRVLLPQNQTMNAVPNLNLSLLFLLQLAASAKAEAERSKPYKSTHGGGNISMSQSSTQSKGKPGYMQEFVNDELYVCNFKKGCRFSRRASKLRTSTTAMSDHVKVKHKVREETDPVVARGGNERRSELSILFNMLIVLIL